MHGERGRAPHLAAAGDGPELARFPPLPLGGVRSARRPDGARARLAKRVSLDVAQQSISIQNELGLK